MNENKNDDDNDFFLSNDEDIKDNLDDLFIEQKKLLILDLDHTLIYSDEKESTNFDFTILYNGIVKFYVKKRPYLDLFLNYIFIHFDIAVWSAGNKEYVDVIIDNIFINSKHLLKFIYYNTNCIEDKNNNLTKPLNVIENYNIINKIIIDNNETTFYNNINNRSLNLRR